MNLLSLFCDGAAQAHLERPRAARLVLLGRPVVHLLEDLVLDRQEARREDGVELFARLLERTYVGTLDCPTFSGRLSGHDALDGECRAALGVYADQQQEPVCDDAV